VGEETDREAILFGNHGRIGMASWTIAKFTAKSGDDILHW
jgi:hypothetical protein